MSIIVNSMWGFVFALMKCSYAAFGEQNKIDNDSKCQLVYKKICSIRFIRCLEQIILVWVANAPSAFFQPKQNTFLNCQ